MTSRLLKLLETEISPLFIVLSLGDGATLVIVAIKFRRGKIKIIMAKVLLTPIIVNQIQQSGWLVKVRY